MLGNAVLTGLGTKTTITSGVKYIDSLWNWDEGVAERGFWGHLRQTVGYGTGTVLGITGARIGAKNFKRHYNNLNFKNKTSLDSHFKKHGDGISQTLNKQPYTVSNYLKDARHVVKHGTFVPEMNGFVRFMSGKKYGFVGIDRKTHHITTFHVKSVKELAKKADSLGFIID